MKKIAVFIFSLIFAILSANSVIARGWYFKTYEVIEVTDTTIVLQRPSHDRKIEIDRSRRPNLKVGDRVRYDRFRNRLRRTLDKK